MLLSCELASRGRVAVGTLAVVCLTTIFYFWDTFPTLYSPPGVQPFCATRDKQATGWSDLTDGECLQRFTAIREAATAAVRNGSGTLLFKHVHKAGGTTLCQLAQRNMIAEDVPLPLREDWTTDCVPLEAFLGPAPPMHIKEPLAAEALHHLVSAAPFMTAKRRLTNSAWLGSACFLQYLNVQQFRMLPKHFTHLTFIASEGPLPDEIPLDVPVAMMTMLRNPLDRVLSSYHWWQYMMDAMPEAPTECDAYWAPYNSTLEEWLLQYPDNWVTRELAGMSTLYGRDSHGRVAPLTPVDMQRAKQRLHYFAAVLIMERQKSSQFLLEKIFGWREIDFDQYRAGSSRNSSAEYELRSQPRVLQLMQNKNRYDIELYEYAARLHDLQLVAATGPTEMRDINATRE